MFSQSIFPPPLPTLLPKERIFRVLIYDVTVTSDGPQPWMPMLYPQATQHFMKILVSGLSDFGLNEAQIWNLCVTNHEHAMKTGTVSLKFH
jgi:hypothetical protein